MLNSWYPFKNSFILVECPSKTVNVLPIASTFPGEIISRHTASSAICPLVKITVDFFFFFREKPRIRWCETNALHLILPLWFWAPLFPLLGLVIENLCSFLPNSGLSLLRHLRSSYTFYLFFLFLRTCFFLKCYCCVIRTQILMSCTELHSVSMFH